MTNLEAPIEKLSRLGLVLAKRLKKIGIYTCRDLIFYFPFRFDDYSKVVPINQLVPNQVVTIQGQIKLINSYRSPRKRKLLVQALVADETGEVKVIWFNQAYLTKVLNVGDYVSLAGKTNDNFYDLQLVSPVYEKIASGKENLNTARLTPVYSLMEGLSQKQFRTLIDQVFSNGLHDLVEWLPTEILAKEKLIDIKKAIINIHRPENLDEYELAKRRFKFEELFLIQLFSQKIKKEISTTKGLPIKFDLDLMNEFLATLPFGLTESQKKAVWEIIQDLQREQPMNRLLEGDVGSGKTVVALISSLLVIKNSYQVAMMAPTEILAKQHLTTAIKLLVNFNLNICLITSAEVSCLIKDNKNKKGQIVAKDLDKKETLKLIKEGFFDLVIGTHALIQDKVRFSNLALVIIDEQHRFGVEQRKILREKSGNSALPHLLSMTATPIPRSLALTVYGDLDLSIIDQMPLGRKKIITKIVPAQYRDWTYDFIRNQVRLGRQVFVICPLIDISETLDYKSVKEEYEKLKTEIFPDLRVGLLHGKLKNSEKEKIMQQMLNREVDVLVSTSVVEVGVDIANASVMMIEGAERFGLAQLHQFRGRVGRGEHQSYCFLLPNDEDKKDALRLKALVNCHNGFELAEKDLQIRGSGDVFGFRQSGLPQLKVATLYDYDLIQKARDWAVKIVGDIDNFPIIKDKLDFFTKQVHLE